MQNPRWPSLLYCLKCCSRDPLGKQRGGDGGTKQKYRKVQKIENLSRVRESGRKAGGFSTSIKSKSRLATQQTGHVIAYTRPGAIGRRQNLSRVSYISHENMGNHLQYCYAGGFTRWMFGLWFSLTVHGLQIGAPPRCGARRLQIFEVIIGWF